MLEVDFDFYMRCDAFAAFDALQKAGYKPSYPYLRKSAWRLPVDGSGMLNSAKLLDISIRAVEANSDRRINYM